jgi:hypothetical protein
MKTLMIALLALLTLTGCAVMTRPIEVTPELIEKLGKDPASACMVNQGNVSAAMYGNGNATSTFCRTNAPEGSLSVDRQGTITIIHGPAQPSITLPANTTVTTPR